MSAVTIDRLIRSKRRTIALMVLADASVVVRAPMRAPLQVIESFVATKQQWIERARVRAQARPPVAPPKQFVDGELFLFLGTRCLLELTDTGAIELTDRLQFPRRLMPTARQALVRWYTQQALEICSRRLAILSKAHGVAYRSLRITHASRRWGSCSALGKINLSWRLSMAPEPVIDSVIVHELAHITHKNHSKRFWDQVYAMMPDYKERSRWLKEHARELML